MSTTSSSKPVAVAIPNTMWFASVMIAMQSLSFGYIFSCLNACLVTGNDNDGSKCFNGDDSSCPPGTIYNDLKLSTIEAQIATSLTIFGAWIGCIIGSWPAELYGKRFTLLCNNAFFLSGAALSASGIFYAVFAGRFVSGLGVGIASSIPSVLLAEVATPETRGTITTLHQVLVTLGIFVSALLGYAFVTYVNHGWQYIQAFGAVPGLVMLLLQSYVPESPKWTLMRSVDNSRSASSTINSNSNIKGELEVNPMLQHNEDKDEDAVVLSGAVSKRTYAAVVATLKPLRDADHNIAEEIEEIMATGRAEANDLAVAKEISWSEVFSYRRAMIAGIGLMFFQAMTGINSVTFYSTTIFGLAGFSESIIGTASFGAVNFMMTILSSYLIDRMGRKILLLIGTYIMFFALLLLSIILLSPVPKVAQGMIAVVAVLIFVAGFALGLGAVVWAVMSELMPTRLRIKAVTLFLNVNWGSNLVIGLLTLSAIDGLGGVKGGMDDEEVADAEQKGVGMMYLIFAGITGLSLAFIHLFVPETKGKTPEELMGLEAPLLADVDRRNSGSDEDDQGPAEGVSSDVERPRRRTSSKNAVHSIDE